MTESTFLEGVSQMIRGFRFSALVAAGVFAFMSTTALASDSPDRVLTTAFPNLPESIAIDQTGTTYLSFPFAGEVAKFAPGGSLSTVATLPGIPLGVRLDAEGNVFIAVIQINPEMGKGVWEVPASGGSAFQVASGAGVWNGMAFDHRGNLYVSDTAGGAIWRFAKNGDFTMWSGSALLKGTTSPRPCGIVGPTVTAGPGPFRAKGNAFNRHGATLGGNTEIWEHPCTPVDPDCSARCAERFK